MSSPVIEEMLDRLRNLWATTPTTVPAASASVLGGVKLKGDLAGTAETPTVPGLAGKADTVHTHSPADVPGLPETLGGFDDALTAKADLVDGKVPSDQLPAIPVSKADVGLGNVDNTADVSKPVSTLQAAALAGKSDVGHAHPIADVSGLRAELDALDDWNTQALRRTDNSVRGGSGGPSVLMPAEVGDLWLDTGSLVVWRKVSVES